MHTWVYGKVEPGWYIARWTWDPEWATRLIYHGYRVERSIAKPD